MAKGDADALRQFLTVRRGRVGLSGTQAEAANLQQQAQALGRALKAKDAKVAASAVREGVPVITRDGKFRRFLNAAGIGGEDF